MQKHGEPICERSVYKKLFESKDFKACCLVKIFTDD
jgi:hypothetical protein